VTAAIRQKFGAIFCDTLLLAGENRKDYEQLRDLVLADVKPRNSREAFLARIILEEEWQYLRMRGLSAGMLHAQIANALEEGLSSSDASLDSPEIIAEARRYIVEALAGDQSAEEELKQLCNRYGLTLDILKGAAFAQISVKHLHADRIGSAALELRNKAYAELDRLHAKEANDGETQAESVEDDEVALSEEAPPSVPSDPTPVGDPAPSTGPMGAASQPAQSIKAAGDGTSEPRS